MTQAQWDALEADPIYRRMMNEAVRRATEELNNTPRHLLDPGNPNHPSHDLHLFGEHYETFLARQYK